MNWLNNSFVRALVLILLAMGFFIIAKWCGAQNVGAEIVGAASMLVGVAAGALKDAEKPTSLPPNTTLKETTVSSSVTDKSGVSLPQDTEH